MSTARSATRRLATAALLLAATPGFAVELRLLDGWSNTLPAVTTVWRVRVNPPAATELTWELILGGAVVDRGQRVLDAAAAAQPVALPVRIPPLREGVTGEATLVVQAVAGGRPARLTHPVWILPADPWTGLRDILAKSPPRLFDPEGTLAARLRDAGLQTTAIRNPAELAALTNGLVIVAEGVSLRTQRGLAEALVRAAAGGARIVLLAPAEGVVPLPGHDTLAGLPRPAVRLDGPPALRDLDKRLDASAWPDRQSSVTSSFVVSAERRQPELVCMPSAEGWAWLDLDYHATGGGCLLAAGWAPVKSWDAGPAPRHVLAALVRYVMTSRVHGSAVHGSRVASEMQTLVLPLHVSHAATVNR